ncbi:hypothetical protein [Parashewanella tropica]|uniref:hypothetical protein n=1 Tax=Parashewanella tropica TaxID=2547970 RepID=UPI001C55140A|nr:hypothetical protein [Parashewanella tropica]
MSSVILENETKELSKYSKFLRKIAWLVEIIVVFIGLTISISLVLSIDSYTSGFILAAPFVMVSMIELTKIPFVVGFWNSRKSFPLYLVMIALLCVITFETLLSGFERAFASINQKINLNEIEIAKVENQMQRNEENIQIALQEYEEKMTNLNTKKTDVNTKYQARHTAVVRENQRLSKNVPALRTQLGKLREELIALKIEKSALLKELSEKKEERFKKSIERADNSTGLVEKERGRLLDQLNSLKEEKKQALDDASFLTSGSVEKRYDEKIRYVENQLSNINDKTITGEGPKTNLESVEFLDGYYADLLKLKDDLINQKQAEVNSVEAAYKQAANASYRSLANKRARLNKAQNNEISALDSKADAVEQEFANEKELIKKIKQDNSALMFEIRQLEVATNTMALSNQVYRMASYVDNVDHYKEIKKETLTLVGVLWFGTLAFIGSITGIALTLSGLHLHGIALKRNVAQSEAREREEAIASEKSATKAEANQQETASEEVAKANDNDIEKS